MRHSIVVGVDGSRESRAAAAVAARLAHALDLRLTLAYAAADPSSFLFPDVLERGRRRRRAIEDGFELLGGIAATLPEVVSRTAVVLGSPAEALNAFCGEEDAELLVVGSRGHTGVAAILDSVSGQLARAGGCPVVVVPPEAADRFLAPRRMGGSVLCGIGGSVDSARAVRVAGAVAERLGLDLVRVYFDHGDPVEALRQRALADEGKMIVVGSRGRGALRRVLLGSISGALAAAAPVPVLVVPPTARLGGLAA
jgi:nucleotide-binding universal stress UspA family protein